MVLRSVESGLTQVISRYLNRLCSINQSFSHLLWRPPSDIQGRLTIKYIKLEMWANAQRDGRPAEHRWRPLFNTAKFV